MRKVIYRYTHTCTHCSYSASKRKLTKHTLETHILSKGRGVASVTYHLKDESVLCLCGSGEDIQERNTTIPIELRKCD